MLLRLKRLQAGASRALDMARESALDGSLDPQAQAMLGEARQMLGECQQLLAGYMADFDEFARACCSMSRSLRSTPSTGA